MSRSTASFIDYELRPAKQTERRILLDYLEALKEAGVQISASRYIGMGGTKFYDFAMVYRFLGISDLVSCERDQDLTVRSKFNRPFARIEVRNEPVGAYIGQRLREKAAVCWLDYDDALNPDIIDDITVVGREALPGTSVFVTVASGIPRDYVEKTEQQRLDDMNELFGEFAGEVSLDDVEEANFPQANLKILLTAFVHAFSGRRDGRWEPYFRVEYRDSTRMLTVGGSFVDATTHRSLKPILRRRIPFLKAPRGKAYKIRSYNITQRERQLFEFAASARSNCAEANQLKALGFSKADLRGYRELVRFMPRYVEAYN